MMANPKEQALQFKNDGNKAFGALDWPKAVECYTKAIELDSSQAAFYSNRAQVYLGPLGFIGLHD